MKDDACLLKKGSIVTIKTDENSYKNLVGDDKVITVSYRMDKDMHVGAKVLLDDGKLVTIVKEIKPEIILVEVQNDHVLKTNKRVNIPGIDFSMPFMSPKDREDIIWGAKYGVDFIAASFVNSAKNVHEIREILKQANAEHIQICSKIESQTGIDNIDEIIEASDSIMIARGDLGLEIPYYEVPYWEKKIIAKCRKANKEVIVATQMLDSMEKTPLPTRAEISDVYWATELGASATMTSGETASGQYPVEAIKTMATINHRAEQEYFNEIATSCNCQCQPKCELGHVAKELKEKTKTGDFPYTIAISEDGKLLKKIAKYKPNTTVIALVSDPKIETAFGITFGIFCEKNGAKAIEKVIKDPKYLNEILASHFDIKKGQKFLVIKDGLISENSL
nr:pyruvate kinase [Mycoplasma arthritidis] [Metamycoplasma arthritidis]